MEVRKVHDPKGVWLVSSAKFPLVDPTTGACFEPGVPLQAMKSDWVKGQPAISDWKDPAAQPEPQKATIAKPTTATVAQPK